MSFFLSPVMRRALEYQTNREGTDTARSTETGPAPHCQAPTAMHHHNIIKQIDLINMNELAES